MSPAVMLLSGTCSWGKNNQRWSGAETAKTKVQRQDIYIDRAREEKGERSQLKIKIGPAEILKFIYSFSR